MKRKLVASVALFVCLALVGTMTYAADEDKSTFNFGPKGGLNLNYQWGGDIPNISGLEAGWLAGLFMRVRLLSFLMLQPEVLYSREVSSSDYIDYIEIPVLIKLGLPLGDFTPNVFAGPMGCFKVNTNADNINNLVVTDALFSVAMGAGLDIDIGKYLLTLEGRWTFSTMDSIKQYSSGGTLENSMKNGTGSILVGFGF